MSQRHQYRVFGHLRYEFQRLGPASWRVRARRCRVAAIPYAQVDPNRVGAGLPDFQQVPGLLPTGQRQFYGSPIGISTVAGLGLGAPQSPFAPLDAYPGGPMAMNTLLQLRAAGLWL